MQWLAPSLIGGLMPLDGCDWSRAPLNFLSEKGVRREEVCPDSINVFRSPAWHCLQFS
jgi:hypothetical protein